MKFPGLISTLSYVALLAAALLGIQQSSKATIPPSASARQEHHLGCLPSRDGYLRARLRGSSDTEIDWHNADMRCDGGLRPGERGVRVTFLGPAPIQGRHYLRLVFGITTTPGTTIARNVPTNVTVIFEDEQKLYSTAGDDKCTIDELSVQPVETADATPWSRVEARGFCIAPASTITGDDTLLLDRFDFAGTIRYADEE